MSDDLDTGRPPELRGLDLEKTPPAGLEERVVEALRRRGELAPPAPRRGRARLAAAALVLVTAGFLGGHWSGRRAAATAPVAADADGTRSRYALLLYEGDRYRPAAGPDLVARYHEYSRWVAWARERRQFVTGEDLAVEAGRRLSPDGGGTLVEGGAAAPGGAALSGVFLIEARDFDEAVELARRLPHLDHGGEVVVQEVVPTDRPPAAGASAG